VCLVARTAPDGPRRGRCQWSCWRPRGWPATGSAGRCTRLAGMTRTPANCLRRRTHAGWLPARRREGRALFQIMDQLRYERLSIGLSAVASAEHAVELTTQHAKERKIFGKPLLDLQNTRFRLAECKTKRI